MSELEQYLRKWQKILRLEGWDISIAMRRRFESSERERTAEIDVDWAHLRAHIAVVDRNDFGPDVLPPMSIEFDVLHEMLHIVLWKMDAKLGTPQQDHEEQAINQITRAFLSLNSGLEPQCSS